MNKLIITIEEARETLRVDGRDNDIIIIPLIEAIPHYLEATTGRAWENDKQIHPLAKTAAKFILMIWYNPQGAEIQKLRGIVDGILTTLTAIGREKDGT